MPSGLRGRALQRLGIELIPAYSPEARGRSERMFGTLQKRLPQELRLAGITGIDEANRFLKEVYLPQHNARFALPAEVDRPSRRRARDILCIQEERTGTTPCAGAPAATTSRSRSGCTSIPTARPSSTGPDAGAITDVEPIDTPTRRRVIITDRPKPCGQVDSRSAPDHFPTGPATTTEAVLIWYINRSTQNVLELGPLLLDTGTRAT